MEMKVISEEFKQCICCMEEHNVKRVQIEENNEFKGVSVSYMAEYFYCENDDSFYCDGDMLNANSLRMRNEYRKSQGLLTSGEISSIREKYGVTRRDMCALLGWGEKTITRYEGYQVQDRAHDSILRKLDQDPEWFLELLDKGKDEIPAKSYSRYFAIAAALYEKDRDLYLRRAIESKYFLLRERKLANGDAPLDLNKLTETIQYYSDADTMAFLYKVKLMKLLWYTDFLSYRECGHAVTGLIYQAQAMGALPIGHDMIIRLEGVNCEEVDMGDGVAYHFLSASGHTYSHLSVKDREIMNRVIKKFGKMTKDEIVAYMHGERAYKETASGEIISFKYAEDLRM